VKKAFLGLAAAIAASASSGATVNITSTGNYTAFSNYTSCTTAPAVPCANFLPGQNVSGTFTTSGPLPANAINLEVGSLVTAYSFSNGLDVIASSDSAARLNTLRVSTDASGNVTAVNNLQASLWLSGATPHTPGDRVSYVFVVGSLGNGMHNASCFTVTTGASGVPDTCTSVAASDTSRSQANSAPVSLTPPVVPAGPVAIPTLSQWGTMLMASLLGLFAFLRLRRQR
jgi:hypothetical protein